jgi:hypothetical protein
MRHLSAHALGLVADHGHDSAGLGNALRRLNHVVQQARSSRAVQDLGVPRAHACAQAGGEDYHGNGGF